MSALLSLGNTPVKAEKRSTNSDGKKSVKKKSAEERTREKQRFLISKKGSESR